VPAVTERSCGDVRVPVVAMVDGHRLSLNGMAVREVTVLDVDIYVAALYTARETRDVDAFLASTEPARLELHFVHDISRDAVVRFLRWGFSNNPEDVRSEYEAQADWVEQWFTDYRAGDVVGFDYHPGLGITMTKNGEELATFGGDGFKPVFFRVFVGPKRSNQVFRDGLVGGVCNE